MRKISNLLPIVILLHAIFSVPLLAQTSLGVRGGANLAQMAFHISDAGTIAKPNGGLTAAMLLNIPLNSFISIQTEAGYTQMGTKGEYEYESMNYRELSKIRLDLNYLEMPVLLQLNPKIGRLRGILNLGPEIRYRVGKVKGTGSYEFFEDGVLNPDESSYDAEVSDSDFKKLDFGLAAGLGISLPLRTLKIFAEARYHFGLSNIVSKENMLSGYDSDFEGTIGNRNLSINVGVLLNLGKR